MERKGNDMATGNGEFKGEMKAWVEMFKQQRLEDLKVQQDFHDTMIKKMDDLSAELKNTVSNVSMEMELGFKKHEKYHKENEHKWGMWTLFKRRPIIPIMIFLTLGSMLGAVGFKLRVILEYLIKLAK